MRKTVSIASALWLFVSACAPTNSGSAGSSDPVRAITNAEGVEDFDQIVASIRGLYGPLERKQKRYGFELSELAAEYRARVSDAESESEIWSIYDEFLARFNDGHVSLVPSLTSNGTQGYYLPLAVMPIEATFVAYLVGPDQGIKVGEEVLSIDGETPQEFAGESEKYIGMPNALSRRHFAADNFTFRPSYLSKGLSAGATAVVKVRAADGAVREVPLAWRANTKRNVPPPVPAAGMSRPNNAMAVARGSARPVVAELAAEGRRTPFFFSGPVREEFGMAEVAPGAEALAKFGLTAAGAEQSGLFAATYTASGKQFLLVRIPDYSPADKTTALNVLRALFSQFEGSVDALVVDQTHNPGGSLSYAEGVLALLTPKRINGLVQHMHGDRLWVDAFLSAASDLSARGSPEAPIYERYAQLVDDAYSSYQALSVPISYNPTPVLEPDPAHWKKPFLMLADELSISCADFVPLIVKANAMGTVFGQRTLGAGGNVEEVARLPHTQAVLSLTRGLGTVYDPIGEYPESRYIEDNGAAVDIQYSHTLADFRAGYIGYVRTFSAAAAGLPR